MNINDVAKVAQVSKATVSRVISGSRIVSKENAERVKMAMEKLGFSAPRKYGTRIKAVAVVIAGNDIFMDYSPARWDTLCGIEECLSRKGISMIVSLPSRTGRLPSQIINGSVDGIVLIGHNAEEELINQMKFVPSVWVNSIGSNDKDNALARNQITGKMAADYLMHKGCKYLAYFNAFLDHPALRTDGEFFIFTAQRSGCKVAELVGMEEMPKEGTLEAWLKIQESVDRAISKMIKMSPRPDGLFVPIGKIVVWVHNKLKEAGIKIGEDIVLLGCGCEYGMLAEMNPRPATIKMDFKTIAEKAIEQLIWKIENPNKQSSTGVIVLPELVEF
jgi:DNA-binding LacI/PurR family transcriptional regulator